MADTTKTKVIKCGFGCTKTYEGQKDFDQDYVDITIKKVVRKIGFGDDDFVIEDKEIITKRPIKEVINSQAGDAGIEAYLKPFVQSGIELPKVSVDDEVQDFSQFPDDLAGAAALGDNLVKMFSELDPALRGKATTPEEFLRNMNAENFKAYILSKLSKKAPVVEEKKEVKEDETK